MTTVDLSIARREWLATVARVFAGAGALTAIAALRAEAGEVTKPARLVVYKDPDCGCCKAWVTHLRASGLTPEVSDRRDMSALKDSLGVPQALRSCHTAVTGRYVIEGHVPATDIKRLLAKQPRDVAGLAVPGMPTGSPGMEMPNQPAEAYSVIAYAADGSTRIFARH
jgi:hypothetical protein